MKTRCNIEPLRFAQRLTGYGFDNDELDWIANAMNSSDSEQEFHSYIRSRFNNSQTGDIMECACLSLRDEE